MSIGCAAICGMVVVAGLGTNRYHPTEMT